MQCIFFATVDHKLAEEEFQHKVCQHGDHQNDKVVDPCPLGQMTQVGGNRGEHQVKAKDLRHSHRHIGGGFECVFAV